MSLIDRFRTAIFLPILALFVVAGCNALRMPLPDDLSAAERWKVEGRQGLKIRERLRFGPYEAGSVERSWTKGRDNRVKAYERREREQHFSFVLRDGAGDLWSARCQTLLRSAEIETRVVDIMVSDESQLNCAFTDTEGTTWLLTLSEEGDEPFEGDLRSEDLSLSVRGTRKIENALSAGITSGYYITDGKATLAAVEVIDRGSVFVRPEVSQELRSVISSAAAALLLVEDLRSTITG